MSLLQQFVNFLVNKKPKRSLLTVKNYKADVGQFIAWFEKEFNLSFDPLKVTLQIFEKYRKARNLSESSMRRHTSSLRNFFNFLKAQTTISKNPLEKLTASAETLAKEDPWMIRNFKNFLYEYKKSNLTIKNYINDLRGFFTWLEEAALVKRSWDVADRNLLNKINFSIIQEYKQRLSAAKFSPLTINRKLSSLRSYMSWAKSQGLIQSSVISSQLSDTGQSVFSQSVPINRQQKNNSLKTENREQIAESIDKYSSFPPIRLMQKSTKGINSLFDNLFILPLANALEQTQYLFWKVTGRKIFKKNIIPPIQSDEVSNIKREFYAPLSISTRYLSTPERIWHYIRYSRPNWYKKYHSYSFTHYFHFAILMTLSCAVGFGIYINLFADTQKGNAVLGAAISAPPRILSFQGKLTDSADSPITKETAILFSLYDDENASSAAALWQEDNTVKPDSDGVFSVFLGKKTSIPDTTFSQNSRLFLGITVGNSPELRPRQELATVPYAANSETLQGLEPITNTTKVSNVVLALDSSGNLSIAGSKAHTFQAIGGNLVLSGKVLSLTTVPGSNSNIEIVPNGMGKIDLSKPIQNSTNNNNLLSAIGSVEFDDTVAILATTSAQAALYINQNSTGVLISASTSGTAKFVVENDGTGKFTGDLAVNGGDLTSSATSFNLLNSTVTTLNLGGAATTFNLGVSGGNTTIKSNLILSSLSSNGGILYTNASGKILQVSAGSSSDCLMGGTTPSFSSCSGTNIFSQTSGAIYPGNTTLDFLIGATSTASALIKLTGTNLPGSNSSWFNAGNVGIGTTAPLYKLDVQDTQTGTAAAQIYNAGATGTGLAIKLNFTGAGAATNVFESYLNGNGLIQGMIKSNASNGITYQTNGVADFAEYFKKDRDQAIEYGSVVCLKDNGLAVKCDNDNNKIIGVASEHPAFLGGENLGERSVSVGLVGQIEVFAANLNGEIKTGDMLTTSDISGVAVKATKAGQIIGKALEDLNIADESKVIGFYDPDNKEYRSKIDFPDIPLKSNIVRVVKIYALVNASWYDPGAYFAQNGDLEIVSSSKYQVLGIENNVSNNSPILNTYYLIYNTSKKLIERAGAFTELMVANLRAGLVQASEIITSSLIITSDSIIVNGQNLKDYIVQTVNESPLRQDFGGQAGIISPISNIDKLSVNIISPLGESLIVRLATPSAEIYDSSFIIQNSSGSAIAKIDDQGNASFSGTINSLSLQTSDASISGTLRAGNILADSITGLETTISNIYSANFADLASYSAQLSYVPDLAAERAQFSQGLMVFGPTSLSDLALAGRLSIGGTMFVTENSIEVLGTNLSLQSLRQGGLSIMGGLIYIDTDGNIKIQGNLSVGGKLAVNVISPLSTSDLVVNNASGSSVLSISQTGDVIASGSGTFAKLNFSLIQPVLAVSSTEVIASSSAGIAKIAPYQSEITIRNALVTNKSVIYITPVGTPSAQTPFLMRQTRQEQDGGSFTVGVQSPTNRPIDFNWLIIN
ncbi:MAG: hypothetical protein A3H17_00210 [Candidatus Levybacteria bacterium RIFCSPLOWO2_12_FULL_37_14]|nr:MAG: Tyrosine recombinase XerC [Candidatus Levybacteria bacterium GW2011_GWA1_37_16]KKQ42703.1 MAG: Tyrosine recombinase XerC [Candidatus Levybacteria bacterium GW2011_GWB1_37_8]OGH50477.1 MAG: hypothetical protein A3H17_00210 [Candidatus Levybacteria bacterium RIFCSPLOWO2_12_FULL_37_14]